MLVNEARLILELQMRTAKSVLRAIKIHNQSRALTEKSMINFNTSMSK